MTYPAVPSWIRPLPEGEPPFVAYEWPFIQLADRLEDRIRAGEFGEDGPLPPAAELMTRYSQKRGVVGHAYQELLRRNLIVRRLGHGYHVRPSAKRPGRWRPLSAECINDPAPPQDR